MGRVVPVWWAELVAAYFRSLAREGCRETTLMSYRTELYDFGSYLLEERVNSLGQIGRDDIEAWQDDLRTRKSLATCRVASSALRGLLKFAAARDMELSKVTLYLSVTMPRVPAYQPRPLPVRDFAVLRGALTDADPRQLWRLRTRALFWVLYSSGCRVSEALSLKRSSFDCDTAVVLQKGGRPHTLVISRIAVRALTDYEDARADRLPHLFLSLSTDAPLAIKEVQESWDLLAEALQIGRFTSHQLRHSCLTDILTATGDVALAARHAGHRDLQTIQNYAAVGMDKRRQAVAMLDRVAVG